MIEATKCEILTVRRILSKKFLPSRLYITLTMLLIIINLFIIYRYYSGKTLTVFIDNLRDRGEEDGAFFVKFPKVMF